MWGYWCLIMNKKLEELKEMISKGKEPWTPGYTFSYKDMVDIAYEFPTANKETIKNFKKQWPKTYKEKRRKILKKLNDKMYKSIINNNEKKTNKI